MAAIEKLIGQSIPRAEGDFAVHVEASEDSERPREQRKREGSRGGRKLRREREPRHGEREPRHAGSSRKSAPQPSAPVAAVPSIGRPEPRRVSRDADAEPADHSHLPAFLLRPVRARV
jgi:hypothetical protein